MGRAPRRAPLPPRRVDRRGRGARSRGSVVGVAHAAPRPSPCCRSSRTASYVRRVAFDTVLYMLLALGLNVVVGWGGLLDLGYVAFYGIGAYSYALLSSETASTSTCRRWSSIPLDRDHRGDRRASSSGCRRGGSSGDYLAIVTLFFFRSSSPWRRTGTTWGTTSPAARTASAAQPRPAQLLRLGARGSRQRRLHRRLPLRRDRHLRGRLCRAALRQPLPHRPGLAVASRGCARRRDDGHARQPGSS